MSNRFFDARLRINVSTDARMAFRTLLQVTGLVLGIACLNSPYALPQAPGDCGSLENGYGPFDYRTATPAQKHIVESYHFTQSVEALQQGKTTTLGGD